MKLKAQLYKAKRDIKGIKGKIMWYILEKIDNSDNYMIWEYTEECKEDFLSDYLNDSISDRYEMRDDYD